jgi:hypothetical protein
MGGTPLIEPEGTPDGGGGIPEKDPVGMGGKPVIEPVGLGWILLPDGRDIYERMRMDQHWCWGSMGTKLRTGAAAARPKRPTR